MRAHVDGWSPYENAVSYSLGRRVDYAMLIKIYAANREGETKYSPTEVVKTVSKDMIGSPTLEESARVSWSAAISA